MLLSGVTLLAFRSALAGKGIALRLSIAVKSPVTSNSGKVATSVTRDIVPGVQQTDLGIQRALA